MKPISGFKATAPGSGYPMLPKGLYKAKIKDVKVTGSEPDQQLVLRIDITEGEYADYYTKRYKADQERGSQYGVKYKGDFIIQVPDENNPRRQHFDWDLNKLNKAMWAIEDSNPGYHWDWNENGLKDKLVGINVRQGTYNGNPYTRIGRLESLQMMGRGECRLLPDEEPRGDNQSAPAADTEPAFTVEDVEIPF